MLRCWEQAFFGWCRSWGLWKKANIDTAASSYVPPWIYTVLGRRWFRIGEKKRRLWKSKPPLHRRVKMCLLYDGFFLLPSYGRLIRYIAWCRGQKDVFDFEMLACTKMVRDAASNTSQSRRKLDQILCTMHNHLLHNALLTPASLHLFSLAVQSFQN